ncbi:E3 ubiquitin ligase RNF4 [Babesia ovata]|uniref:E3 ubiquitin ligase RNF4 n=1 Tax=Babesia ovata TaxID=189622 RepID=A0A2H6KG02_9APIC|nr:E3 ubiquitin ligase RNF4 [Babesia ovata]GBE61920.1 E3 ubiquitin ligase RNF4 [Babesia ovata]
MVKRKTGAADDGKRGGDGPGGDVDDVPVKRLRPRWIARRISSEDTYLAPYISADNSPSQPSVAATFTIRGEDLDLLGGPSSDRQRRASSASQLYDGDEFFAEVVALVARGGDQEESSYQQSAGGDSGCGASPPGASGNRVSDADPDGACATYRNDVIRQHDASARQASSDDDVIIMANWPGQDLTRQVEQSSDIQQGQDQSGDSYENNNATGHIADDGNTSGTEEYGHGNAAEQSTEGVDPQGSESDCEIIGIVPNRHGVVMNHRVVPTMRGSQIGQRRNGMGAFTTGAYQQPANQTHTARPHNDQTTVDAGIYVLDTMVEARGASSHVRQTYASNENRPIPQLQGDDNRRISHVYDAHMGSQVNATHQNQNAQDDDLIVGPIFWGPPAATQYPRHYHANSKAMVSAYSFVENDTRNTDPNSLLEDIEFLFRCPICYSTIARFKSGKMPNENDRIIYSTKCGHMYCFECMDGVKKRRECPICRKPIRDSKQYHVIYP